VTPGIDDVAFEHSDELSIEAIGADEVQVVPWPLLLRKRVTAKVEGSGRYPWIVLVTVLFGLFSVGFTITILANSRPRIAADLHSSESLLAWLITGPILAFAVFGPAAGKLGDLKGHRRIYLWSMAGVCVFAALTAAAPNAGALIAFRVLGAATGAATGPASLALINRLFPRDERARAMGYWSMVGAGGPVVGVVAGGPLVEAFGWRWIFVAQVPLTLLTLLLAYAILPETPRADATKFDTPGAVLLGGGTLFLLLGIDRGAAMGWGSAVVLASFMASVASYSAFVAVERRSDHPLLSLAYLRRRNFTFPLATQFFTNFAYMGAFIVTPLFLQHEFGYSETHTAWVSIARPLTFAVAGPVAGYLTLRIGERTSAVLGGAAILASMVALAQLVPGTSDVVIVAALGLSGLGMGASTPAMAAAIANSVDERDLGIAGATQQMVNQIGVVLGIQIVQTVQVARAGADGAVNAYHEAYFVGALAAAFGVAAAFFVRRSISPARDEGAPEGAHVSDPVVAASQ
jgi:EmrB/QacA subfamily drug resistance transporter